MKAKRMWHKDKIKPIIKEEITPISKPTVSQVLYFLFFHKWRKLISTIKMFLLI